MSQRQTNISRDHHEFMRCLAKTLLHNGKSTGEAIEEIHDYRDLSTYPISLIREVVDHERENLAIARLTGSASFFINSGRSVKDTISLLINETESGIVHFGVLEAIVTGIFENYKSAKQAEAAKEKERIEPQGITAAQLQTLKLPPLVPVVAQFDYEGVVSFDGPPKTAKSWMALNKAACVASGEPFLGRFKVTQGDVLYLALEDGPRRIQSRLNILLDGRPFPEKLNIYFDWPCLDVHGLAALDNWLTAHPDCVMVIIDVLAALIPDITPFRQNQRYEADYQKMRKLKVIGDKHHCSILAIGHTRETEAKDIIDRPYGNRGKSGAADIIQVLERSRGSDEGTLHIVGRDIADTIFTLRFDEGIWSYSGGGPKISPQRREIQRVIRDARQEMAPTQVANALGKNINTIRTLMRDMVNRGELYQSQYGFYSLPKGEDISSIVPIP